MDTLTRKNAIIVTGGGRGIGRAVALRLALDAAVVVVGRTEADLRATCEGIVNAGGTATYVVGDVRDRSTAEAAVASVRSGGWRMHALVCNAGIGKSGAFERFDMALWQEIMDVNLLGAVRFCQAVIPNMLRDGGTICLMSSIAGIKGYAFNAAYDASKHGLIGLARSLAKEFGPRGISVVPVCPGFVESEMTDRTVSGVMSRHGISREEAVMRVARNNPQRRIIPQSEIAETVAFVCSGKAPSLSGNPLVLSGGE